MLLFFFFFFPQYNSSQLHLTPYRGMLKYFSWPRWREATRSWGGEEAEEKGSLSFTPTRDSFPQSCWISAGSNCRLGWKRLLIARLSQWWWASWSASPLREGKMRIFCARWYNQLYIVVYKPFGESEMWETLFCLVLLFLWGSNYFLRVSKIRPKPNFFIFVGGWTKFCGCFQKLTLTEFSEIERW